MTEEEFREMERRMAINRGEVEQHEAPVGWPVHTFEPVGDDFPNTCVRCACFRDSANHSIEWPEHMIEAECTRLLEQDGWRSLRTDPVSDRGRGKGFGELGMADHLYIRYGTSSFATGQVLWIEFKSANGKPAKHQTEWHTKERARGAVTWIAGVDFPASVAGFVEHYRKSGLNRGRV